MTIFAPKQHHYFGLNSKGLHRLSYIEWGEPTARPLICVHGLSRNSHDFDDLAHFLSQHGYWVICPDIAGRGTSDWLQNPADYRLEQYLADIINLINRLNVDQVDWLGSSMGGLLGMLLASLPNTPIKRLIVNDIGPTVEQAGLDRLQSYVGQHGAPSFNSIDAAERYFRQILAPFGYFTDQQWRHLTKASIRPNKTGGYTLRCDPAIKVPQFDSEAETKLWDIWHKIKSPSLVLRGETSDILSEATLLKMKQRHSRAQIAIIPNCGHAPALNNEEQMQLIRFWLQSTPC